VIDKQNDGNRISEECDNLIALLQTKLTVVQSWILPKLGKASRTGENYAKVSGFWVKQI
jgi:hypothetical protein